ncbi:MAG: hypothetical protein L0Y58_19005 [Verrucomicrobia subdivision 3 bacterium]|nr:hypothetical protein [Limisphaerales bacterium]
MLPWFPLNSATESAICAGAPITGASASKPTPLFTLAHEASLNPACVQSKPSAPSSGTENFPAAPVVSSVLALSVTGMP